MIVKLGKAHVKLKAPNRVLLRSKEMEMLNILTGKLVRAVKGTRELDVEIHCLVTNRITNPELPKGYTMKDSGNTIKNNNLARSDFIFKGRGPSPHYTTSIDSALRLLPEITGDNVKNGKGTVDWMLAKTNGGMTIHACAGSMEKSFAETPALALCIAALKSREEVEKSGEEIKDV